MSNNDLFVLMFTGTWCLVGVIFLCVGIGLKAGFARREERLRARAAGTVTEIVRRTNGDSSAFYPIVSFEYEGRTISLESRDGGGRKRHYEGQSVEVLYDPDDPTCFRLDGEGSTRLIGNIFLAVGLGCIAIGIIAGMLVHGFRNRIVIQ